MSMVSIGELSAHHRMPAPAEGYRIAADGTRLRHVHWRTPAARLGAVLYLNGRTEFIEKTMDVYAILLESGFDVWTLDWRGQGLSGRALADPEKGHVTDFQDYLDDLEGFVGEVTDLDRSSGKTILLAHSMGGHIGLRFLHDRPGLFAGAVFSAPMIDLSVNNVFLRAFARTLIGLGLGGCYAPGTGRFGFVYRNPDDPSDNGGLDDYRRMRKQFELLTGDAGKFMEIQRLMRANRALALGGPTTAWLDAAFRSIDLTWSPGYAESIETPVLMVGGGQDRVVMTPRQEQMAKRLPNGRFLSIGHAAHELLVECDDIRLAFFEAFAAFAEIPLHMPGVDMSTCVR